MADAPVSAKFSYRFLPLESPLPSPDLFCQSKMWKGEEGTYQKWKAWTETPYEAGVTSTKSPRAISTAGTSLGGNPTR